VNEFETERALICAQHNREVHELQDIMYAMDQCFEDRDADARTEFQSQRDELKNKVRTAPAPVCFTGNFTPSLQTPGSGVTRRWGGAPRVVKLRVCQK